MKEFEPMGHILNGLCLKWLTLNHQMSDKFTMRVFMAQMSSTFKKSNIAEVKNW